MDPTVLMDEIGLGLVFWEGTYLDVDARWLRFVDREGRLIPTGLEKSMAQAEEAQEQRARADEEKSRADRAEERARQLEERLRELEGG